jgi:hypothetical protein
MSHQHDRVMFMQLDTASASNLVAIFAISIPALAALGGVWIKGHWDRRTEHRQARRSAYADFIGASRILAVRSLRYRFDQTFRGSMVAALRDVGPLLFGVLILTLKYVRRALSANERIGLLGLVGTSSMSLGTENETLLYEGLEEMLRTNAALRIVGSEAIIEASDDVLDISRRLVDTSASTPAFTSKEVRRQLDALKDEFDGAHNKLLSVARKEFPGL